MTEQGRWNQSGKSKNENVNITKGLPLENYLNKNLNSKEYKTKNGGSKVYYSGSDKNINQLHLTSNYDGSGAHWSGKDLPSEKAGKAGKAGKTGHVGFSSVTIEKFPEGKHNWASGAQDAHRYGKKLLEQVQQGSSNGKQRQENHRASASEKKLMEQSTAMNIEARMKFDKKQEEKRTLLGQVQQGSSNGKQRQENHRASVSERELMKRSTAMNIEARTKFAKKTGG